MAAAVEATAAAVEAAVAAVGSRVAGGTEGPQAAFGSRAPDQLGSFALDVSDSGTAESFAVNSSYKCTFR